MVLVLEVLDPLREWEWEWEREQERAFLLQTWLELG